MALIIRSNYLKTFGKRSFCSTLSSFFGGGSKGPGEVSHWELKDDIVTGNKIVKDNPAYSIVKYENVLKKDKKCHKALIGRAFAYLQINETKTALEDAELALSYSPLDAECYVALGTVYMKQEEYTIALDNFLKAIDLTSPLDPRYDCTVSLSQKCSRLLRGEPEPQPQPVQYAQPVQLQQQANPQTTQTSTQGNLPPFTDPQFLQTQNEISQKMFEMGTDDFKKKMEELAALPELQAFQAKILSGQQPTMEDYYKLYQEPTGKFAKFAANLQKMQEHPDLKEFARLAATGDWNVAFGHLKNDSKAMDAYMAFFQEKTLSDF